MSAVSPKYNVYVVQYKITRPDPYMPQPRYHHFIFVETDPGTRAGWDHHVTGDLIQGMRYERKRGQWPANSDNYYRMDFLGSVPATQYPDLIDKILVKCPPPPRQKRFNPQTNKIEPIKPDGSFYKPGEQRQPLQKCTEWTMDQAIPALRAAGILPSQLPQQNFLSNPTKT